MAFSRAIAVVAASGVFGAQGVDMLALSGTVITYPGYAGNLSVSGYVQIGYTAGNQVVMDVGLSGLDPNCTTSYTTPNACGIHIHSGTTCAAAGGHYTVTPDPWAKVSYVVNGDGTFRGANIVVPAGTTLAQNAGKTFVVHDSNGTRISCAVLQQQNTSIAPVYASDFTRYTGYNGTLTVTGLTAIYQAAGRTGVMLYSTSLSFRLLGVDPRCDVTANMTAPNSCGIHVHTGACSIAGGHYYAQSSFDPWTSTVYFSDASGNTGDSITVLIDTNATVASMIDRSIVVHDFSGARVGCAGIRSTLPTTTVTPTVSTTSVISSGTSGTTIGSALAAVLALMVGGSC